CDGNGWLFQEVTTRLPGRVQGDTRFGSQSDLAAALRRAAAAHGEHEKRNGGQHDANWPDWYAEYIVKEQAGEQLPVGVCLPRHCEERSNEAVHSAASQKVICVAERVIRRRFAPTGWLATTMPRRQHAPSLAVNLLQNDRFDF